MIKVDLLNLQEAKILDLEKEDKLKEKLVFYQDHPRFGDVFRILQITGEVELHPLKHGSADIFVRIEAVVRASCDSCGEDTEIVVKGSERFLAKDRSRSKISRSEQEIDLTRDELDEVYLEDRKFLDLVDILRDSIFMNIPTKLTCLRHQDLEGLDGDKLASIGNLESISRYQSSASKSSNKEEEKNSSPFLILESLKKKISD